jgi:hypothetical protein
MCVTAEENPKKKFFLFCFYSLVLLPPRQLVLSKIQRALALVDAAAVKSATVSLAVREAADAAMAKQTCILLLLCTDTAVLALALLAPPVFLCLTVAGVAVAAATLELFAAAIDVLLEALSADLAAFVVVKMEGRLLTVEARLRLLSEVGTKEPLEAHEAVPESIAVGRDEGTAVAVEVTVFPLLHVGRVGVVVADVAVGLPVVLVLVPGGLVVLFGGRHL